MNIVFSSFVFLISSEELNTSTLPSSPKNEFFQMASQLFMLLFMFIIVIIMAYYVTKWIASSRNVIKGSNLRIIESISITQNGAIQLVKVGKKFYLIGVTKENITFLSEIDKENIDLENINPQFNTISIPFEKYLGKYMKQKSDNSGKDK